MNGALFKGGGGHKWGQTCSGSWLAASQNAPRRDHLEPKKPVFRTGHRMSRVRKCHVKRMGQGSRL
eukprot:1120115-Rhodomonas_salina.2